MFNYLAFLVFKIYKIQIPINWLKKKKTILWGSSKILDPTRDHFLYDIDKTVRKTGWEPFFDLDF